MKVVILAGGLGTRLAEETINRPKPMVEIGGFPILWHIMKYYSAFGHDEFIICCGYKGYMVKEYFANYFLHTSDITFDLSSNEMLVHRTNTDRWKVTLVDTGVATMTGGRLKAVSSHLKDESEFCLTYGDGLSDIDINETISFHRKHGRLATISAVLPPGRFGALTIEKKMVSRFEEKPLGDGGKINGGFFVLSPEILDFIDGPETVWEKEPLSDLATAGELVAYEHAGFWQPMDTLRDRNNLEALWSSGSAPWKVWG